MGGVTQEFVRGSRRSVVCPYCRDEVAREVGLLAAFAIPLLCVLPFAATFVALALGQRPSQKA